MIRRVVQLVYALTLGLLAARAVLYAWHAAVLFGNPLEAFYLEAPFVHLAWRVQAGLALYPDFQDGPHVANFFGPGYFLVVGHLGRWSGADLEGLPRIGRGVSIVSTFAAAAIVGLASGRRAGLVATLLALESAPLIHFGAMVRPDLLADTLGIAGFLAAIGLRGGWRGLGVVLLVAAAMTKQTTGVYAIAAVAGLLVSGKFRAATGLAIGTLLGLGMAIGWLAIIEGGRAPGDLLGAGTSPTAGAFALLPLQGIADRGPELPFFALIGLGIWAFRKPRKPALAVLAVAVPAVAVWTARKIGSDLNYFLGLRLVAALGAASLWGTLLDPKGDRERANRARVPALLLAVVGAALLVPGLRDAWHYLDAARAEARFFDSEPGRATLASYRALFELAADPSRAILTDSGPILLRQGDRAPFADPWIFRLLCLTGRVHPELIRRRIADGDYDAIVTTADLADRGALNNQFALPPTLLLEIPGRYAESFAIAPGRLRQELHVYIPLRPRGAPPEALEQARRLAAGSGATPEYGPSE